MANKIRGLYDRLEKLPFGLLIFSKIIGRMAPYTGTIGARVNKLRKGYGSVQITERRALQNHLNSVHAVAMANLAEITSGLAFLYGIPTDSRAILSGFSIKYLKKGRGTLIAHCHCPVPEDNTRKEYECLVELRDKENNLVAQANATWLLGPVS